MRTPDILTIMEVAKWLQLSRATVYKLIREGKIPAFRMGSDWRFSRKDIAELMQIGQEATMEWGCLDHMKIPKDE